MNREKLKERIKYWSQLLLLPIYGLSFLVPRDKKIWLFGSTFGRRFADSPRYFYLYLSEHKQNKIRPIWITENEKIAEQLQKEGYEAYNRKSLKGKWYCLRGGVYLYDNYPKDISHWLSGGALKINLWHGVPLKKIQRDNQFDKIRHPENVWEKWKTLPRKLSDEKPSHYILATSAFYSSIFSSAFGTKKVLINRYPRTDVFKVGTIKNVLLPCEEAALQEIQSKLGADKKMLLYMPTFRESEKKFFDIVDLEHLNKILEEQKYVLCVKLHCKSKLKEAFEKLQSSNIVVIDPTADPYVFIELSSVLITDYSSIYFDYLLTDKPIIFFCYDLNEYLQDSREIYFDYDIFTPGPKAATQEELEKLLGNLSEQEAGSNTKRKEIKEKAFIEQQSPASEELYKQILTLVN